MEIIWMLLYWLPLPSILSVKPQLKILVRDFLMNTTNWHIHIVNHSQVNDRPSIRCENGREQETNEEKLNMDF